MLSWYIIPGQLLPLSFIHLKQFRDVLLADKVFVSIKGKCAGWGDWEEERHVGNKLHGISGMINPGEVVVVIISRVAITNLVMVLTSVVEVFTVDESLFYPPSNPSRFRPPWISGDSDASERFLCFTWLAGVSLPLWCWPSSNMLPPSVHRAKYSLGVSLLVIFN